MGLKIASTKWINVLNHLLYSNKLIILVQLVYQLTVKALLRPQSALLFNFGCARGGLEREGAY